MQNEEKKNGGINSITGKLIVVVVVILLIAVAAHFLSKPPVSKVNNVTIEITGPPTTTPFISAGGTRDLRQSTLTVKFKGWIPDPTQEYTWIAIQADTIIPDFRSKVFPLLTGSKKWTTKKVTIPATPTFKQHDVYYLIISK